MSRLQPVVDRFTGLESSDDIMQQVLEVLTEEVLLPEPGKFYTFVYRAKTPNIEYDEFPLIACIDVQRWGFVGFSFHWGKQRNYTWEEVIGKLHVVKANELEDARSLGYAKFRIST
jgi:hypothetical protein